MIRFLILSLVLAPLTACGSLVTTQDRFDHGTRRFQDGFSDAAATPLEDLNIRRDEIPAVLIRASENPYNLTGLSRCPALVAEIHSLEFVLGPDVDESPGSDPLEDRAADAALSAVADAAGDLIPMRSWVRRISGAHAHSARVQRVILAGTARRSFLKGVAQTRRCRR
jgi:hypothetical protein